ncbi:MAG: phosphonate ABC transporter, permease protein PhnE [Burkholderiaceae bacterium]
MASMPSAPVRWRARLGLAALAALLVASFWTLDLQWAAFLEPGSLTKMGEFIRGFFPPVMSPPFLSRLGIAAIETLAMSALGTLIAAVFALALAIPASLGQQAGGARRAGRAAMRLVLNVLRSIPELVWAALLVIAAGLGPFPGTLALAAHTTGVLGRLFADALENLPREPAFALRANGATPLAVLCYATLPLALPQLLSYSLYRWENNIRAAAVLGVVGAGGLGQMLHVYLSLFKMQEAAGVVIAMLLLVGLVDGLSYLARRTLTR